MQKFSIPVNTNMQNKENIQSKIKETLLPILQWYDPYNHSDLYYIKIYINKSLYIVTKMLMPFDKNPSSYIIYSYMGNGTVSRTIFSMSISKTKDLDIVVDSLSNITVEFINTIKSDEILIVTNLDSKTEREQRGFMSILNTNKSNEEKFVDFVYYIGQTLDDHINYALMRLDVELYPDTDPIRGSYEVMIHSSKVFNRMVYDISFAIPQMNLDPIFGISFEELVESLEHIFQMYSYFNDTICIGNETSKITYYIIKQEVAY